MPANKAYLRLVHWYPFRQFPIQFGGLQPREQNDIDIQSAKSMEAFAYDLSAFQRECTNKINFVIEAKVISMFLIHADYYAMLSFIVKNKRRSGKRASHVSQIINE